MTSDDFDLLCSALAFTAVAMKDEHMTKDSAQRATGIAYLIKEFCRTTSPRAFAALEPAPMNAPMPPVGASSMPSWNFETVDNMASIIVKLMRENDGCLPQDLLSKGFSSDEIDRHWAMAKALAHVELDMMDS